jgi:hypothetical protein
MTEYEMRSISARVLDDLGLQPNGQPELTKATWRVPYFTGGVKREACFADHHDCHKAEFALRATIVKAYQSSPPNLLFSYLAHLEAAST